MKICFTQLNAFHSSKFIHHLYYFHSHQFIYTLFQLTRLGQFQMPSKLIQLVLTASRLLFHLMGSHSSVNSIHPLDFHSFATSIRSYKTTCIQTLSFHPQAIQNHVKYQLKRWAPCKQVPSSLTQLHHRKQLFGSQKKLFWRKMRTREQ